MRNKIPQIIVILEFDIHSLRKNHLGEYVYIVKDLRKRRKIFKGKKKSCNGSDLCSSGKHS